MRSIPLAQRFALKAGALALALPGLATALPPLAVPAAAQSTTNTCSDGQRRWLEVRNLDRLAIYFVKHRDAYSYDEWSEDMLGDHVAIPSGQYVYIAMPSGDCQCDADIQVTFEDGQGQAGVVEEYRNVHYCSWTNDRNPLLIVGDAPR